VFYLPKLRLNMLAVFGLRAISINVSFTIVRQIRFFLFVVEEIVSPSCAGYFSPRLIGFVHGHSLEPCDYHCTSENSVSFQ